jgi:hypothetical protein
MTKTFKYRVYPTKEQLTRLGTNQFGSNTNTEKLIGLSHK